MTTNMITETCSCGASITVPNNYRSELPAWRADHRHSEAVQGELLAFEPDRTVEEALGELMRVSGIDRELMRQWRADVLRAMTEVMRAVTVLQATTTTKAEA